MNIEGTKHILDWVTTYEIAHSVSQEIEANEDFTRAVKAYPIPRGGVYAALLFSGYLRNLVIADTPEEADILIDDIYDTGSTYKEWHSKYPEKRFYVLIDKRMYEWKDKWIVLPWENNNCSQDDDTIVGTITNRLIRRGIPYLANNNIHGWVTADEEVQLKAELVSRCRHLLRGLLIDIDNDHNMQETAERMAKMYYAEVFAGRFKPYPKLTSFPNAKKLDDMYVTGPISVRSTCSHHLQPIIGSCWIGIVPGDTVVGLSKFNRIVEWFASRPQIQEELVMQIADFLEEKLAPKGIAVVIKATHHCMTMRGVKEHPDATMTTNVMRGVFREDASARSEFLSML